MHNDKHRILGMSDNPLSITGYANQSRELFRRLCLLPEFETYFLGCQYIGQPMYVNHDKSGLYSKPGEGYLILPRGEDLGNWRHPYCEDVLPTYLSKYQPDLLWILLDTFMVYYLTKYDLSPAKTVMWFPSDGVPMPLDSDKLLRKLDYRVAMSKFAQKQVLDQYGIECSYIPHGIDLKTFYPIEGDRKIELRKSWSARFGVDLTDKFIVGTVARFQGRKNMPEALKVFSEFIKDKNDAYLILHMSPNDPAMGGNEYQYIQQIKNLKIDHRVIFTGMTSAFGFSTEQMNELYNLFDVHFLTTCYHPKTPISTSKGFKEIENVEIGDDVLTSDGTFQKVEDKVSYKYNKKILKVETAYNPSVLLTPNHRVYGVHCKNHNNYQKKKVKGKPEIVLKPIEEFKEGDFLVIPRIKEIRDKEFILFDGSYISNQFGSKYVTHPRAVPLQPAKIDEDFMWLSGFYLAEGCLSQKKGKPEGIVFCLNTKETEYTNKVLRIMKTKFNLEGRIKDDTRHRRTIWFNSASLGRKFKELFGSGAKNKSMPEWMLYLPYYKQEKLVNGYLDGDGHFEVDKRNGSTMWRVDTVSAKLAYEMRLILIRLGYLAGYHIQQRQSLVHRLSVSVNNKNSIGWMDDNYFYIRISRITETDYKGLVYDLTVSKNHNYCNYWLGKNTGEGFGIPTVEAMACNVPSVTTDFTTAEELVGDDRGERIEVRCKITGTYNVERAFIDHKDALDKLNKLYYDRQLLKKYSQNCRPYVQENYNFDVHVYPKWLKLIKEILDK